MKRRPTTPVQIPTPAAETAEPCRRRFRPPLAVRSAWLCAATCLLLAQAAGAESGEAMEPDPNAALDYLKAVALMQVPRSPDELAIVRYLEENPGPMPPAILGIRLEVGKWLLNERESVAALREGAARKTCRFDVWREGNFSPDLRHLPALKRLTDRALQTSKAFQYVDNQEGAAAIFSSLFRMPEHLDQEREMTSGIFAAELLQRALLELGGFLSRKPRTESISLLSRFFARMPKQLLHPSEYVREQATRQANWLLANPNQAIDRLRYLYGDSDQMPAVDQLITLERDALFNKYTIWVEEYRAHMMELSASLEKPYHISIYRIQEMDAEKLAMRNAAPTEGKNPLIPLLVPSMEKTFERFLLAEAHARMADILCGAALYRAELKKWPGRLEDVSKFLGREFGRDPFTGTEIQYRLIHGEPTLATRAPKWLAEDPRIIYRLDLSKRVAADQKAVEAVAKAAALEERRQRLLEIQERAKDAAPANP